MGRMDMDTENLSAALDGPGPGEREEHQQNKLAGIPRIDLDLSEQEEEHTLRLRCASPGTKY